MLELLFVLALIGLAVVRLAEWLYSLPCFPVLAAGLGIVPLLAIWEHSRLMRRHGLELLRSRRNFLPPERFYWAAQRRALGRQLAVLFVLAAGCWFPATFFPQAAGWVFAGPALVFTGLATARAWLYVQASQTFSRLAPGFIGVIRRALFRISDNYDFLDEENPRCQQRKNSVY